MRTISADRIRDTVAELCVRANRQLPGYSKITAVERQDKPFEKTPKMSIRRFLYK